MKTPLREPLRIGLIGAGMIGQLRARALASLPEARLVMVADVRQEAARQAAALAPGARIAAAGLAVAEDPAVEAVVISTPPADHEPLGTAALAAGKHVLCEKPLAHSIAACERLVCSAEDRGLCLATGFTLRHTPAARLARSLVDSGAIGEIDHVRAFHGHSGGKDFGPAWIVESAVTGGGTLMDNGIHMIDLVRWFLGDVAKTGGYASNHTWRKPGCEDNGFVLLRSTTGRVGVVHSSWTEWRGYGYRVEIYGTRGYVRFGYPPLWLVLARGEPGHKMKIRRHFFPLYQIAERLRGWQWSLVETLTLDLKGWIHAIRDHEPAPASGRDGLEAVRIALSVESGE